MTKYLSFIKVIIKEQFNNILDVLGTIFSFVVHITIFSFLWEFVLEGKALAGYTKQELIWYVIISEIIMYSYNYYYRKVANKVEMGDFAYDMTKPYNFLLRTIAEGIAELPITLVLLVVGCILGIVFCGVINITIIQLVLSSFVIIIANLVLLLIHLIVGLLSIWLGRDVSSIWLLCQKAMLIFAFSPIELFPKAMQKILLVLPTTHVIYTPASLFVHFSMQKAIISIAYILVAFVILGVTLFIIYKKGVKKQNVNGI